MHKLKLPREVARQFAPSFLVRVTGPATSIPPPARSWNPARRPCAAPKAEGQSAYLLFRLPLPGLDRIICDFQDCFRVADHSPDGAEFQLTPTVSCGPLCQLEYSLSISSAYRANTATSLALGHRQRRCDRRSLSHATLTQH